MMQLRKFSQKRICVAVSGGADSVTLLHYLKERQAKCGFLLSVVHCEHGIRGAESLADMHFVRELCMQWNIPFQCFSEDCIEKAKREKLSLETAAREFRYACFHALLNENKTDYIALAHHADDEAETILFRLARGTSISGVRGMQEECGAFLRPLLSWTKRDIEEYAAQNGLQYRIDKTNLETDATRNKLRLEVLPKLVEAVPNATGNLLRFAALMKEDDELLYSLAQELLGEKGDEVRFCEKKPLFCRACLLAMQKAGVERDYTARHLEALFSLQYSERGAKLDLPYGVEAERLENSIIFRVKSVEIFEEKPLPEKFTKNGFDGGRYALTASLEPLQEEENGWKVLRLDMDKVPKTAVFRFRQEGDEIERFGGGRKTLKKFFNEEKTAVAERAYLPLIAEENGTEVYAVCGVEISEKVKITPETQRILYISIRRKEKEI